MLARDSTPSEGALTPATVSNTATECRRNRAPMVAVFSVLIGTLLVAASTPPSAAAAELTPTITRTTLVQDVERWWGHELLLSRSETADVILVLSLLRLGSTSADLQEALNNLINAGQIKLVTFLKRSIIGAVVGVAAEVMWGAAQNVYDNGGCLKFMQPWIGVVWATSYYGGYCISSSPKPPSTNPTKPPSSAPSSQSVSLAKGPAARSGYYYAVTIRGFTPNSAVSISCRDSVDPGGFYTFSLTTDGSGAASASSFCYSGDGPDHWVVADGRFESNHVQWSASPTTTPIQPPSAPTASVILGQGPAAPAGYRYAVTLNGFPGNAAITISCHDSVDPSGFYTFGLRTDAFGHATTSSYCYSGDGPDHWVVANGIESNHVRWGAGDAPQPVPTSGHTEVAGPSGAGTFTNFTNAGGTVGSRIAPNATVTVTCRLTGFKVANGNTWWYQIASSPWNGQFYASADNFYNNGQTSGSLRGTPFYDPAVPVCGTSSPQPSPSPLLPAPTGVTATLSASNDVLVSWNAVAGASAYDLWLNGQRLLQVGPVTSFSYGRLACGKTYTPGVQALASGGQASTVATTTVTTFPCPPGGGGPQPTPLAPPTGLKATFTTESHLTLSWNPVTDATSYNVYLNGQRLANSSGTSYDYGAFPCGRSLSPGVQALASGGQISTVSTITVSTPACPGAPPDSTPPSVPTGLTVYFPTNTGFTLGWNAATDNVGVTGYNVYIGGAKVASVGAGETVPALGSLGYVFNGLSCGTTYQVAISASDAAGNTSAQATRGAATSPCPSSVPAPTGVQATVDSSNNVVLSWNEVSGASGYYLWLNGSRLLRVSGTSFPYGKLTCGQTFTLGVQTIASDENVSAVATTTVTTNPC